jgi:hypothetical protein
MYYYQPLHLPDIQEIEAHEGGLSEYCSLLLKHFSHQTGVARQSATMVHVIQHIISLTEGLILRSPC